MLRRSLIAAITFAALAPASSALADELCMSVPGVSMQALSRQALSRQALSRQALSRQALSRQALSWQASSTEPLSMDDRSLERASAPRTRARLRESLDVGPFFSSDGTSLISSGDLDELFRAHEVEGQEGTPLSEILWCWSGDDPRCSPRTPPHDAPHALQTGHRGIPVDMFRRWPALEDGGRPRRGALLGGPREGVRDRVDRPPRG